MPVGRKIARSDDHDDRVADVQIAVDAVLIQRDLRHVKAEHPPALGDERPLAAAAGDIELVLLGKPAHPERIFRRVAGEVDRHHRQARRSAAGKADDALIVFTVAPALVPLQQQRHGLRPGKIAEVDRRGQVFFLRIVAHKIARVGVAGIQLHERVRIIGERGFMLLGVGVQLALRALGGGPAARKNAARKHAKHDQRQQRHKDSTRPRPRFLVFRDIWGLLSRWGCA